MKPPDVHQSVEPPKPASQSDAPARSDDITTPDGVAADLGEEARAGQTIGQSQGLVGDFGPIVDQPAPDKDGASEEERRER